MGGFISRLFRRGNNNQIDPVLKDNLVLNAAQADLARGDSETDIALKRDQGIRYDILHDEDTEDILSQKCLKPQLMPAYDEQGKLLYERDKEGNILLDGHGNPIIVYKQGYVIDNTFAALKNMLSPVNRCVFLDPRNKQLVRLQMEDIIEDAKMNLPERDFDLGLGSYLDSQYSTMLLLTDDATNGNKVKALLEIRKINTLDLANQKNDRKGLF